MVGIADTLIIHYSLLNIHSYGILYAVNINYESAVYDEMVILCFTKSNDYKRAFNYFELAYDNCKLYAECEPNSAATRDLEYIFLRKNSSGNA